MEEEEIISIEKLFQDKKLDKLDKVLPKVKAEPNDIKYNIYYYFFYECTNQRKELERVFEKLKILFHENLSEMYCKMGKICEKLSHKHLGFYSDEDYLRFYMISIRENSKNPESLFQAGRLLIINRVNVKKGIELLNKSLEIEPKYLIDKENFLVNIYIISTIKDIDNNYKNEELKLILKEINKIESTDFSYFFQKIRIFIALKQYKKAEKEFQNINYNTLFRPDKREYNRLSFYLYFKEGDLKKALNYSKMINKENEIDCLIKMDKNEDAIKVALSLLEETRNKPLIHNYIAKIYFNLKDYDSAIIYIDKNLNLNRTIHYYHHFESLLLKSDIFCKRKDFLKSIEILEQAELLSQTEKNLKVRIEDILIKKITTYKDHYFNRIESINAYKIDKSLNKDEIIKIVHEIRRNSNLNYQVKDRINFEIEKLLSMSSNKKEAIKKIESEIKERENKILRKNNEVIEKTILDAKSAGLNDEYIDFLLSQALLNQDKIEESIKNYLELLKKDPNNYLYLNDIAVAYEKNGQLDKALAAIKKSEEKSSKFEIDNILNNYLEFLYKKQKVDKAYKEEHIGISKKIIKEVLINDSKTSKMTNNGYQNIQYVNLFKYKNFNTNTIDSIVNEYFYFSELSKLNDPFDIPIIEMSGNEVFPIHEIEKDDVKIFSLSYVGNNTLMWSHYADSHKGICIGYRINSLPHFVGWDNIEYIPEYYDHNRMSYKKGIISAGFFSKHKNWEYEKEVRLTVFDNNNKIYYKYPINPIERNNKIEAYISEITLGYKFKESQLEILKPIVSKLNKSRTKHLIPRIQLFRTEIDPEYPFVLKKIRI